MPPSGSCVDVSSSALLVSAILMAVEEQRRHLTPRPNFRDQLNLSKEQAFYDSDLVFRVRVATDKKEQTVEVALKPDDSAAKKLKVALGDRPEILSGPTHIKLRVV
jgi:hypothetical protein